MGGPAGSRCAVDDNKILISEKTEHKKPKVGVSFIIRNAISLFSQNKFLFLICTLTNYIVLPS